MKGKIIKREGTRGVTWQAVIDLPRDPITGKRRQKWLTASTKQEVEDLAVQMLASIANGGFSEADAKKLTVTEYLARWADSIAQTVRPLTQRRYKDLMRTHVTPTIGRIQLAKLTPLDIQGLYSDRLTTGKLSATSVNHIHVVLHRALRDAVRWGLLTRNVTEAVTPPRPSNPTFPTWTQEQAAAFLAVADRDELAALWRLALFTGMRRGELLGLKWEDVDLTRKVVAVNRSYSRSAKGGFEMGPPKSAHGRRSIAIPDSVVRSLQKHKVKQNEHRLHIGEIYKDDGMVFATPEGKPLHANTMARSFEKLVALAGVPKIRIHDLRHTSATLMLANNVHPKIVQERLGHSDVSMTLNRYSHVTMGMQREAADKLDTLMDGIS